MKKSLLWIVVLVLSISMVAAFSFAGCKKEAAPAEEEAVVEAAPAEEEAAEEVVAAEPVTINFMNFSANEGGRVVTLDLMKSLFEQEHPNVTINIETVGWDNYFTQLQIRVGGGEAPDCFEVNFDNFISYADQNALLPLNDLIAASPIDPNVMTAQSLEAFALGGSQYGLPYSYSTVVLVYNKDLFDQAQVAYPTDSWTWAEVDAAATKIKEALGDDYFGIIQPLQFWEFFKIVKQNGGSLLNADNTAFTVNSPENVETLQHAVDRMLVTNISPTPKQMGGLDEWGVWKLGKTGMIVTGIWCFPTFTTECAFNWDIAVEPGNTTKATHYFANALCVSKDSPDAQVAYDWIKFLTTSKEMALARVKAGWELPAANYADVLAEYVKTTPPANKQAVFDSLQYVITQPPIVEFNQMADIIGQELSAAADGTKTPQQALDDAQAALEARITLQ